MADDAGVSASDRGPAAIWQVHAAALREAVRFTSEPAVRSTALGAEWCSFFMALGWFHHHIGSSEGRSLTTVVRAPCRECCSAFAALGALVDSASLQGRLDWKTLLGLDLATRLHVRIPTSRKKSPREPLPGIVERRCEEGIWVSLEPNAHKTRRVLLTRAGFQGYHPTLGGHVGLRAEAKRVAIWPFYRRVAGASDEAWLVTTGQACEVIGGRSDWERNIQGIYAVLESTGKQRSRFALEELLNPDTADWHLKNCTPGNRIGGARLTIFDGIKAFLDYARGREGNSLIILDEREFDQNTSDMVTGLVDDRLDEASPLEAWLPAALPAGIGLASMWMGAARGGH